MEHWLPQDMQASRDAGAMNRVPAAEATAGPGWRALPLAARLYVAAVLAAGVATIAAAVAAHASPNPTLLVVVSGLAFLTSTWKVTLPLPISNGATLSVSYAANVMALLLLGTNVAIVIAVAGALIQCTYKVRQPYPWYRTLFSAAAAAITMGATAGVYAATGGPFDPAHSALAAKPLVATIGTYFVINTGLVAAAIALSTRRGFLTTWRRDFLWSGASFMVAGTAGALAAVVIVRGDQWKAVLLIAPIYLTYRTYEVFVGRLEDQKRHMVEMRWLHHNTVTALGQAREAERALAAEKERLATALADMTLLEQGRAQLLEREQAARTSAEEANRVKDEFLAVVSHELRTPLNAILGWSDMLRRRTIEPALHDRAVAAIYASAKRQAELIDDLLDVSRIVSGKLRLERAVLDLETVVRDAVQVVQPAADAKGVKVAVDADTVGPVYGDAARLQQIVWNLLSNAVKFTPAGGVVRVGLHRNRSTADLVVADTGQGISKEFLPWIFDAFRQADGSTTRTHTGLGLGLSIVKSLVEAHGGTVWADSDGSGQGATFTVRLPLVAGTETAAPRRRPEPRRIRSLRGVAVLVVDDDEQTRDIVSAHLQQFDASVMTAASAAEALDVLQHRHVDVLLADIAMPGEDGYQLIRRIRSSPVGEIAAVRAAAMTAFARDEDRAQALQAGFQLHLAKPVDGSSLVSAVATLGRARAS